jgi:hypothetical protein
MQGPLYVLLLWREVPTLIALSLMFDTLFVFYMSYLVCSNKVKPY